MKSMKQVAVADPAAAMVAALGDSWKALSGLAVAPDSLAALQSEYLADAVALWNRDGVGQVLDRKSTRLNSSH